MSRTIAADVATDLQSSSVELYFAVELLFDNTPLRIWTGLGDKVILSNTYSGVGSLLGISGIGESNDLGAKGATITLSGVDTSMVSTALQVPYQNRGCNIYMGTRNGTAPINIFSGQMDVMTIEDSGDSSIITLQCESRVALLDRPVVFRYTSHSQRARYPDDTFFDWVTKLADKPIYWGKREPK